MMEKRRITVKSALATMSVFLVLSIVGYLLLNGVYLFEAIPQKNTGKGRQVIGPLMAGITYSQAVDLPLKHPDAHYSLSIQFATYQRPNEGRIELTITQKEREQVFTIDALTLEDNRYRRFDLNPHDYEAGPLRLELTGTAERSFSAATAWARGDSDVANSLHKNGEATGVRLCYRIERKVSAWDSLVEQCGSRGQAIALLLVFSFGLSLLIACFGRIPACPQ